MGLMTLKPYEQKKDPYQITMPKTDTLSMFKTQANAPVFGSQSYLNGTTKTATPESFKIGGTPTPTGITGGMMSTPTYKALDTSALGTYKSPISDWTAYKSGLVTSGENKINSTYQTAENAMRDTLGGGGLYGSSIFADSQTNMATEKANALSTNEANAATQMFNAQLQDAAQQNEFTKWLGSIIASENQNSNAFGLDTWKSNLEADTTRQGWEFDAGENLKNRLWQTGENTANRDNATKLQTEQQKWQSGENTLNRDQALTILDKTNVYDLGKMEKQNTYDLGKLEKQNIYDLGKLDKTFAHDDTTLDKTQTYNRAMQEYLSGKILQGVDPTTGEPTYTYQPGVTSMAANDQAVLNYLINSMLQGQQIAGNKEIANISADAQDSAGKWSAGGSIAGAVLPGLIKYYFNEDPLKKK